MSNDPNWCFPNVLKELESTQLSQAFPVSVGPTWVTLAWSKSFILMTSKLSLLILKTAKKLSNISLLTGNAAVALAALLVPYRLSNITSTLQSTCNERWIILYNNFQHNQIASQILWQQLFSCHHQKSLSANAVSLVALAFSLNSSIF